VSQPAMPSRRIPLLGFFDALLLQIHRRAVLSVVSDGLRSLCNLESARITLKLNICVDVQYY
jgi:hypothetical protein